ncbi:hypothetical protein GCM10010176_052410 [Nonomuraea spiralis]|nr:hypothetical protein GCM10010176_052410 [Nonomuraea spiralis]
MGWVGEGVGRAGVAPVSAAVTASIVAAIPIPYRRGLTALFMTFPLMHRPRCVFP